MSIEITPSEMAVATQRINGLIHSYERYIVAETNFNIYKRRHYQNIPATSRIIRRLWNNIHFGAVIEDAVLQEEVQMYTDADLLIVIDSLSQKLKHLADAAIQIDQNPTAHHMQRGTYPLPPNVFRSAFDDAYCVGNAEIYTRQHHAEIYTRQQYIAHQPLERRYSTPNSRPRPRPFSPASLPLSRPSPPLLFLPQPRNLSQQYYADIPPQDPTVVLGIQMQPPIKVKYEQKLYTQVTHDDCAICYTQYKKYTKVTTNCNHSFCVSCINKYTTHHSTSPNPHNQLSCPMCRTEITEMRTHTKKNVYAITRNPETNIVMEADFT